VAAVSATALRTRAAALSLFTAACSHTFSQVDRSRSFGTPLHGVPVTKIPVRGYTVAVETQDNVDDCSGELIAVDGRSLYVDDARGRRSVALGTIKKVTLVLFRFGDGDGHERSGYLLWGILGSISTLTHGFFAILTFPGWVATTAVTTALPDDGPRRVVLEDRFNRLWPLARYPQGLPVVTASTGTAPGTPAAPPPAPSAAH
jgi:hypothetical protein